MAETNPEDLDSINQEDVTLDEFDEATDKEVEDAGNDPAKLKEIIKARTATRQRLYARTKKAEADAKASKDSGEKDGTSKQQKKSAKVVELGYGEKGFLVANGIKGKQEFDLVTTIMTESGKSLDDVLESRYFQTELKALRDENATLDATPKGNGNRGGQSARNTVEYWIQKGELPPTDQVKLRRDVVREKTRIASTSNKFGGN